MANRSRLAIAKDDILASVAQTAPSVLTRQHLAQVLAAEREGWRLAQRTTVDEFISFLQEKGQLQEHILKADEYDKELKRFTWGTTTPTALALSIRQGSYLTHGTAVWLHGLNDLIPKTIYINAEQSPKPRPQGSLTQSSIDLAFSRPQRQSRLVYSYEGWQIVVIAGKNTGQLGVQRTVIADGTEVELTDLERTLIDIVVRPAYAGGLPQVLEAFERAREHVSTNRLIATLKKLDYIYPYHQAIGFLMQRANYAPSKYKLLHDLGSEFRFHLGHALKEPQFDDYWQLFIPKDL